jgi:DNA-binding NarL/FixJ family response regulator
VVVVPAPALDTGAQERWTNQPLATLVIDRQPLFLAALSSLLAAPPLSARVVIANRSDHGLEMVRGGGLDLVFCEVGSQPMSGTELVQVMADELPQVPVILLSDHDDEELLTAALLSRAAGVFTKDSTLDEFLVGVRAVVSGHRAISSGLMGRLLERLEHPNRDIRRGGNQLSPTELEILAMIGHAESIPAIAASRGISAKTVRNHLAKIYRKLELHGRTEAMLWAARMGLTSN